MLQKLRKKTEGFTIIEVMIVLAIAALILVVVLIAIPQLQRAQRNAARRDINGRIKTELDNFAGNNNGTYPVANAAAGNNNFGNNGVANSFVGRYMTGANVNINDPSTAAPVLFNVTGAIPVPIGQGTVYYRTGNICAGELPTTVGATPRSYAVVMGLEGGAGFCLDNR